MMIVQTVLRTSYYNILTMQLITLSSKFAQVLVWIAALCSIYIYIYIYIVYVTTHTLVTSERKRAQHISVKLASLSSRENILLQFNQWFNGPSNYHSHVIMVFAPGSAIASVDPLLHFSLGIRGGGAAMTQAALRKTHCSRLCRRCVWKEV